MWLYSKLFVLRRAPLPRQMAHPFRSNFWYQQIQQHNYSETSPTVGGKGIQACRWRCFFGNFKIQLCVSTRRRAASLSRQPTQCILKWCWIFNFFTFHYSSGVSPSVSQYHCSDGVHHCLKSVQEKDPQQKVEVRLSKFICGFCGPVCNLCISTLFWCMQIFKVIVCM